MTLDEYKRKAPEFAAYVLENFPWASWKYWEKLYQLYNLRGDSK